MIKEFIYKQNTLAALLCFGLIALAVITQKTATSFMHTASIKMLIPLNTVDSIQCQIINNALIDSSLKTSTLKQQFLISREIKSYYKNVSVAYYKNYYAFSICSIFFTTLLTIGGFLIANKGWQNSSIVVKTFVLTTVVLSSVYYFLPKVLNNKENLKSNIEKVAEFEKIQSDILSIANSIKGMEMTQIDSSITSNYKRLSTHLDFLTTIDDSELQNEFGKLLKQFKQNN
jgi:hypothetical protein